jgi:hypothetical protein
MMSEAEKLSRLHLVPILLGDNERTDKLIFDRSKPSVLSIPINHYLHFSSEDLVQGRLFSMKYVNEFVDLKNVSFQILSARIGEPNGYWPLVPVNKEKHSALFKVTPSEWDTYTFFAKIETEVIDSFKFEVRKKDEQ